MTLITGSTIQNGTGSLLSSGSWKFAGNSLTVSSGAISGSIAPARGDVLITDASGNHLLFVPSVFVSGTIFDWDDYVQPANVVAAGKGTPYLAAQVGAQYVQTNAQGAGKYWDYSAQGWVLQSAAAPTPTPQIAWAAPAAPTLLQRESVLVTSAEILAMTDIDTAPIQIVPAPGPGFAIVPLALYFQYIPGSIEYVDGGFTFGVYPAGNPADALVSGGVTATVLGMTATTPFFTTESSLAFSDDLSKIENLGFSFSYVTDVGAVVSAGNGSLVITMTYETLAIS